MVSSNHHSGINLKRAVYSAIQIHTELYTGLYRAIESCTELYTGLYTGQTLSIIRCLVVGLSLFCYGYTLVILTIDLKFQYYDYPGRSSSTHHHHHHHHHHPRCDQPQPKVSPLQSVSFFDMLKDLD